ncbi:hypothetical protein V8F20_008076 [Naviculisporaceae sp. PSN 640]
MAQNSVVGALQHLRDLGIIEASDAESTKDPALNSQSTPSLNHIDDQGSLRHAGSLGPGFPIQSGLLKESPSPKKQPPLFWKAMGFFLKKEFCSTVDDQAIFFANPRDVGIAGGTFRPVELTNYQVFQFADGMQRANRPSFSLGEHSYFAFLDLYLRNVGEAEDPQELVEARNKFLVAKANKDQAWESARLEYIEHVSASQGPAATSLIEYIDADPHYKDMWDAELKAQNELSKLLPPEFASLLSQINTMRLADSRLEPQRANNMPVIAVDADWIRQQELEGKTRENLVDPKNVYYRPCYSLPNYEATVNDWYAAVPSPSTMVRNGPHVFPLANILNRKWADLGHPLLDNAKLSEGELTSAQIDFINSLDGTLTFLQEPYVGHVTRGPWDINGSVRDLYDLRPGAPKVLQDTVLKTTKLIIAWGMEIELTIPDVLPVSVDTSIRNVTLAGMDLPLQPDAGNKNKLVFRGGGKGPILIGAIADMI